MSIFFFDVVTSSATPVDDSWDQIYKISTWFGSNYLYLLENLLLSQSPEIIFRRILNYRIVGNSSIMWVCRRQVYVPCIPESKILSVLREVHDDGGHWVKTGTLAKFRKFAYWPQQSADVEKYIFGYLSCARHGPVTRSQPLHFISVCHPFQLLGIDFIGPLKIIADGGFMFIFHVLCYFFMFSFTFPNKTTNAENVIRHLGTLFFILGNPITIYWDRSQHFKNVKVETWLQAKGIHFFSNLSGNHKSIGMVEINNRLLKNLIRRNAASENQWENILEKATRVLTQRTIFYLGMFPASILFDRRSLFKIIDECKTSIATKNIHEIVKIYQHPVTHAVSIRVYLQHRAQIHDHICQLRTERQKVAVRKYNKGIRLTTFQVGNLVMLHQKRRKKLDPSWRGPFSIAGYGKHGMSFSLRQINGRRITGSFHGDDFKRYVPRSGHLFFPNDPHLFIQQIIRKTRNRPPGGKKKSHEAPVDFIHI